MKRYKRNELESGIREPQPQYLILEEDLWASIRYYLTDIFAIPWYAYILYAAIFAGVIIVGEWGIALILLALMALVFWGLALWVATSFRKIANIGTCVGFDENGVGYWVPTDGTDEEGNTLYNLSVASPWYELNEIKVFDSFMVLHFVRTSELRLVFVPLTSIDNEEEVIENILAYWKQNAQDKPADTKDRRLLGIIIFIVIIALRFILKYLLKN